MTPFLPSQSVRLRDGSVGTIAERNMDGTWRVWFDRKNWKGDKSALDSFGVAKVNVKESEME